MKKTKGPMHHRDGSPHSINPLHSDIQSSITKKMCSELSKDRLMPPFVIESLFSHAFELRIASSHRW